MNIRLPVTLVNSKKAFNNLLMALAVIYILSPVDLIPDFIPLIGWLDDLFAIGYIAWSISNVKSTSIKWILLKFIIYITALGIPTIVILSIIYLLRHL